MDGSPKDAPEFDPAAEDRMPEETEKAGKLISEAKDPELAILRGHLLAEEMLHQILRCQLEQPEYLEEMREPGFYVTARLARSVVPEKADMPEFWEAADRLNELRNHLAHHIAAPELKERIQRFFDALPIDVPDAEQRRELNFALGCLHGGLAMTLDSLEAAKVDE